MVCTAPLYLRDTSCTRIIFTQSLTPQRNRVNPKAAADDGAIYSKESATNFLITISSNNNFIKPAVDEFQLLCE
ncbi:hypothetical protein ACFVW1_36300 [Streptomyces olivochromogenes]|uniref:hypothetical protein n=1 Tax=Streptomyces olivochromogenes TaxID=1963 RepID=UPI0036DD8189